MEIIYEGLDENKDGTLDYEEIKGQLLTMIN